MRFTSTREAGAEVGFAEALLRGIAPDGGLYVPQEWPHLSPASFAGENELPTVGTRLLQPFAQGDELAAALPTITREAFNFPAPLVSLGRDRRLSVLELFHGPTAAFKDFGARFLAASLARLRSPTGVTGAAAGAAANNGVNGTSAAAGRPLTILVATSGDTGGAVAAAFHGRPGIEVAVLFPQGLVSPTQERQLTCWGDNVRSFAVRGTFDDCQRMVKEAFRDPQLKNQTELSSANSINLGRLLPQAVYYATASLTVWRATGERASFIVPSGNLGNSVACLWAREVGLPIADVVLAHNANRTVPDYFDTGDWRPRPSVATLACSMDVGDPSNMERLRSLFPQLATLRGVVSATSVSDSEIRDRIRKGFETYGQIWCPHTAAAAEAYDRLPPQKQQAGRWVIAATAHAAKFREIVEPLIGREVPMPDALAKLFARPTECTQIDASLAALRAALLGGKS